MTDSKTSPASGGSKTSPEQQRLIDGQVALHVENTTLHAKVNMARAFIGLYIKGYAALVHHGVNMWKLPEYNDRATLDRAMDVGTDDGGVRVIEYCKRVNNAIDAAVRRKQFTEV